MSFDCTLNWTTSDLIALFSFVAACVAAYIAYVSTNEAKKANRLTLYAQRRPVYDAFIDLDMHMAAKAQSAERYEVSKFYHHQHTALFCFDEEIYVEIKDYYRAAFFIADEHCADPNRGKTSDEVKKYLATINRLSASLKEKLQNSLKI